MRHIGDHGWLNQYIGTPYQGGARGPEAFDCYGLCKAIYANIFGITLPDWHVDGVDVPARAEAIGEAVTSGHWHDLTEPADGCFVVCYRTRAAYHLGLYFADGVVHAHQGTGVVYEPLPRFLDRFGLDSVRYGRWEP